MVALTCGAVAHASAHGHLPGPGVLAGLLLLGTAAAAPALRRAASGMRLAALLVLGQAAVHVVLTALSGHDGDEPASHGPEAEWLHHLTEDLSGTHALMAVGHAASAAAVALWLAVGERALWELLRLAARVVLPRRLALPVVHGALRVGPATAAELPPRGLLLAGALRRRGPPVVA